MLHTILRLLCLTPLVIFLSACGGGSSDAPGLSGDATLSVLSVSGVTLDQVFQSSQKEYTGSVNFLTTSVTVGATLTDATASIRVNGTSVDSGSESITIALNEGDNTIQVVVTAGDGSTTETYTVIVTRATAASFAQQSYLKASNADDIDFLGRSVALSGDTLVVGANGEDSNATGGEADNSATDAGAAYVFVRDGATWSQQAYLKASNAEGGDDFGWSVALSGDTLVVGAYREDSSATGGEADNSQPGSGAAYVFIRSGTSWSQQAYLKASNAEGGDGFGWSVAISDDTLVVGALDEASSATGGEADDSEPGAGAVYVFTRSGTSWNQQAYLKASNAETGDVFGRSVAISGDTLVVGAHLEDSSATGGEADNSVGRAGAAYVFIRNGTSWSQQAYLKASNAGGGDLFGYSVALSGDTVVVGARDEESSASGGEADNSESFSGAAYVFTRSGTSWSQQAYLKASNAEAGDRFGYSVAIDGDRLVVSAVEEGSSATGGEADNSANLSGAAYVFTRSGTTWSQQPYLKASNAGANDRFGQSVAISGDTLAVGAEFEDSSAAEVEADNSTNDAGAVYTWQ